LAHKNYFIAARIFFSAAIKCFFKKNKQIKNSCGLKKPSYAKKKILAARKKCFLGIRNNFCGR